MSVWSDERIRSRGSSILKPFDPSLVNPASYDVRLGNQLRVLKPDAPDFDIGNIGDDSDSWESIILAPGRYHRLWPGQFVLGHTIEVIRTPIDVAVRVEGKSSLARGGLLVHATAGWVDPGFHGSITLEFSNVSSRVIRLVPGALIGQVAFYQLSHPARKPYDGNYQDSVGAVAARRRK